MFVLDTDHASELGFRSAAGFRFLHRLSASGDDAVITAITVEEQMRGWLARAAQRSATGRVLDQSLTFGHEGGRFARTDIDALVDVLFEEI